MTRERLERLSVILETAITVLVVIRLTKYWRAVLNG